MGAGGTIVCPTGCAGGLGLCEGTSEVARNLIVVLTRVEAGSDYGYANLALQIGIVYSTEDDFGLVSRLLLNNRRDRP